MVWKPNMWRLGLDWKCTTKYWLHRWKYDVNWRSKMNIIKTVITCFHNTRKWCWCSDCSWATQRWKAKSFSHLGVKLRRRNTFRWKKWLFHKTEKWVVRGFFFFDSLYFLISNHVPKLTLANGVWGLYWQ